MQFNQQSTNNQEMGCLTTITTIELPKQTLFDVLNEKTFKTTDYEKYGLGL